MKEVIFLNKKLLVIGVLIVLIIVLAVVTFKKPSNESNIYNQESSDSSAEINIGGNNRLPEEIGQAIQSEGRFAQGKLIEYRDSGFSPAQISVKLGESVTWINQSGKSMWVASADHPEHKQYPGFDQLQAVENGGQYSFNFQKEGSWNYHNHSNPVHTGIVVVSAK